MTPNRPDIRAILRRRTNPDDDLRRGIETAVVRELERRTDGRTATELARMVAANLSAQNSAELRTAAADPSYPRRVAAGLLGSGIADRIDDLRLRTDDELRAAAEWYRAAVRAGIVPPHSVAGRPVGRVTNGRRGIPPTGNGRGG